MERPTKHSPSRKRLECTNRVARTVRGRVAMQYTQYQKRDTVHEQRQRSCHALGSSLRSVADSTVTYCRIFIRTERVGLQVGVYTCPIASHEHRRTRVHVLMQRAVTPQRCICPPDRSRPPCNPGNAWKVIGVVPETVRTSRFGSSAADVSIPALSRAAGQSG